MEAALVRVGQVLISRDAGRAQMRNRGKRYGRVLAVDRDIVAAFRDRQAGDGYRPGEQFPGITRL